jgi:multidrug efflux pump subunit AcrA (membrane-fusion protein)
MFYRQKTPFLLSVTIVIAVLLTSCEGLGQEAEPTNVPITENDFTPVVAATGKVVPEKKATLSFPIAGIVSQIHVIEGQRVQAGEGIISLKGEEDLQAAVSAAESELIAAQIDLDNILERDYDLLVAEARKVIDDAQDALDDLNNPELQQALALQAIADTEQALEDAEREVNRVKTTAKQADIDAAKAQVILAEDALEKAREDFEPYENKPEDNLTRANLQARLSAAKQSYDDAVRRLNSLQSTGDPTDIAVAEANLSTARAELLQAKRDWEKIKDGPDLVKINLLNTQIKNAQRDLEKFQNGPDPDEIALAEARIKNAEAQFEAAMAALDDLDLAAPFSGVITELLVDPNEWISLGQAVVQIADLERLQVETTDLSEIDVARIEVGNKASITFDALPDVVTTGDVTRIAPKATEGAGVNYTVLLELIDIPPGLLWGMTAFVDIEAE